MIPLVLILAAALLGGCATATDSIERPLTDVDLDGWPRGLDCEDRDSSKHPGAAESCNGEDDDCDGVVDDNASEGTPAWRDADGDGWGDPDEPGRLCLFEAGWATNSYDCDDSRLWIHPSSVESCRTEQDDNCDGDANSRNADGCTRWYVDADGDGAGSAEFACLCVADGTYTAGAFDDCDDTDPALALECGRAGFHALGADTPLIVGTRREQRAGAALVGIGDVDADGWSDVLIGAGEQGKAWIVRGPMTGNGDLSAADGQIVTPTVTGYKATTLTGGPDLDGDGAADVVLGVCGNLSGSGPTGAVYFGAATARGIVALDAARIAVPGCLGDRVSVAIAGDTDGDGASELFVGFPWLSTAVLVSGDFAEATDLDAFPLKITGAGSGVGHAVAGVGDLDGDGLADLAIGAPDDEPGGHVWVYSGPLSGSLSTDDATAVITGDAESAHTGAEVAAAGDLDGDGYGDLLAGLDPTPVGVVGAVAWIFSGPVTGSLPVSGGAAGVEADDRAGPFLVSGAGDVDGDGFSDVGIGAAGDDVLAADGGRAGVFFGPLSGVLDLHAADRAWASSEAGALTGSALAPVGDLDGDGAADLLLGSPGLSVGGSRAGAAWLLSGGP